MSKCLYSFKRQSAQYLLHKCVPRLPEEEKKLNRGLGWWYSYVSVIRIRRMTVFLYTQTRVEVEIKQACSVCAAAIENREK